MFSPKQEHRQTVEDMIKLQPISLSELLAVAAGNSRLQENDGNKKKLTKLLVNVTIQKSLGVIKVVISPEKTVEDLIQNVLEVYMKERRRPLLSESNPRCFELHYTQFNLESLDREEKLMNLGSRNFFLCPRTSETISGSSCSDQAKQAAISYFQLPKFMDFLL